MKRRIGEKHHFVRLLNMNFNCMYLLKSLFENKNSYSQLSLDLSYLHLSIRSNIQSLNLASLNLIDLDLFDELKRIQNNGDCFIYIGKTLRDIKCIIENDENFRQHEIFVQYKEPKKLYITKTSLPYTNIEDNEYTSIIDIINAYKKYINDLSSYFYELELIDQQCMVMEPINPTFKDDYRRILIDERTWLHVKVTQKGIAADVHLMGPSQLWYDKLQEGLLSWDHDKSIINNIMTIFDLAEFPQKPRQLTFEVTGAPTSEPLVCSICLCTELPDIPNIPLPLCQNSACGVYFHRYCLYEWLVVSENRPPVFGVATGSCPSCLQLISCKEIDT